MHIIKRKTLIDFYEKHPSSKGALEAWFMEVKRAEWADTSDVKSLYRSADFIKGNRVVFNICGNNYRLIVKVNYQTKTVFIRFIGTHAEYSKIDAEKV
jgi:mRNA interferase HigB